MYKNYLKIAWRNLFRNKAFSLINISGLAMGLTCSLLIIVWVQDERRVDGFHINGRLLYQVYERNYFDGKVDASYSTQGLLADELKRVVPEIQYASGFDYATAPGTQATFELDDKVIKMAGMFAGEDFLKMFSFHLLQGKTEFALNTPSGIAISRKMAGQFFGDPAKAIGKTLRYDNKENLVVTGVFENPPASSSLQFDYLRTWKDFVKENKWVHNWGNTSPATYLQLKQGADGAKVEAKIKDFIYNYKDKDPGNLTELTLQPFGERYLYSTFKNGYIEGGRIEYVRLFSIIAVFILAIACINFMNLATARSGKRAKEIGIRKVAGALRTTLIAQFAGEALLLTFIAIVMAILLAVLLLPTFNTLTGKQLDLPLDQPSFWLIIAALLTTTGLISGSYPALYLASLKPVQVLKGTLKFSWKSIWFRRSLVVLQFSLSIVLIVGMIVIYRQVDYVQTKNLGYDRENLVYIPIEGDLIRKYDLFKQQAGKVAALGDISKMRNSPTIIEHHTNGIDWPGKPSDISVPFADAIVGFDFIKTMHLKLQQGRDFSTAYGTDSSAFIVNETAVKKMDLKSPLGENISWGNRKGKIIGVVQDFHFNSMHQNIEPLIIRLDESWTWGTILVRIKAGKTSEALAGLEKICTQLNPKVPFTYQFSDEEYSKLYRSEQVVSRLANTFALLAISISCLGLFGLATFTAEQRTREIGVRKVLGATMSNIISILSANFLKLVVIAFLIAVPAASYLMNKWLQGFAYRIDIDWWMFLLAGVIALCIALLTVLYQSIKAALANPVKSLRTE